MEDFTKRRSEYEMTVSKFKVGDRVYAPHFGEGIVTGIDESKNSTHPIHVKWTKTVPPYYSLGDCFTPDGRYTVNSTDSEFDIVSMEEAKKGTKFHLGDRVYAKFRGYGTVTDIYKEWTAYPIEVTWDKCPRKGLERSTYTKEGNLSQHYEREDTMLTVVPKEEKGAEEMRQIVSVINHNISSKEGEKMDTKSKKFKVGDRVFSSYYGFGVVYSVNSVADSAYPVEVKWENPQNTAKGPKTTSFYTVDGKFRADGSEAERDIYPLKISSDLDEEAVDPMIDTLDKKTEDAINPSHYKIDGLPDAIDIINHLMHREQYEGFLWGNIIKYAYRFGRKGDKAETAGKIAWYATQLRELEEERGDTK